MCSKCILQPQPTGKDEVFIYLLRVGYIYVELGMLPLTKILELAHLEDIHLKFLFSIFLAVSKIIIYKMRKILLFNNQRLWLHKSFLNGGARGVMVIVVGNGHGQTSSNPGPG